MKWKLERLISGDIIKKSGSFPTSFTNSDILLLYNIIITSPIPTTLIDTKVKNYDRNFCSNNFSTESKIFELRSVSFQSFEYNNCGPKKIFKGLKIYYYNKHNKTLEFGLTMYIIKP